ncbi:RNA polymerase sigma-70 factor [Catalinimonas sp. 4WD22]|uniref:RNA polymerase sigma-70 factor n=1 Tax=Catalinimonas locisalis TaxID=3133978 RepID=UPI003101783F
MADHAEIKVLLSKVAKGNDKKAFRTFYDNYYQKIFHWAIYFVKSEQIAEEVVSEVFVRIWKNRKQMSKVIQLDNYLFIATKRQSLNLINQRNKRFILNNDIELPQIAGKQDAQPEYQYMQQEFETIIEKTIDGLPPRCRLIFQMVRLDGMKYQQVAELLQISNKTVENQLLKATLILRKSIQNYQQHADMQFYLSNLVKLLPLTFLLSFI